MLSGMLMSSILFEKRIRLKDFYIRRFSRIIPAFTAFVVVIYTFSFIQAIPFQGWEVVSTLGFFRTYFPLDPHIWSTEVPIGHLWSLNVEEHAYIIMRLLTLVILRNFRAAYVLTLLGLASIGVCFYYYSHEATAPVQFRIRTESAVSFVFLSAGYNLFKNQLNIQVPGYLPVVALFAA
ncbi:MAG: acyltransferase, partial [Thiotrichaceae bacterium]|nr:acyltransferase [Thiotrichaceae bacterium]